MSAPKSIFLITLLTTSATACDESSPGPPGGATDAAPETTATDARGDGLDPACDAVIAGCRLRQRTCEVESGEPRCVPCPAGQAPDATTGLCSAIPGTRIAHDFGTQTVTAGQEIGSLCQTWVLDNDEELWVHAVEMDNDGFYHHSNWFFVPEDYHAWPTEPWIDCYDEGFHEIDAALAGGVVYAQSTQVKFELQKFASGAAIHIPPRSRIITVTHLLNYTQSAQTTGLRLALYTLPRSAVTTPLTPAQLVYSDLEIPPRSESFFGSTCDLRTAWDNNFDTPMNMKLHYVLAHYHTLGAGFEVTIVGGARDGEVIVDLGAYSSDPFGFVFDPPLDLSDATGLRWGCKFDNPTEETVHWGIGDQEMCEALLFFDSPMAFTAGIGETTERTTVAGLPTFSGACTVLAFPFSASE